MAALIGSTFSYAAGGVYARRFLRDVTPITTATFELLFAFGIVAVLALVFESPIHLPANPAVLLAPIWLGIVGSGIAFMLFFRLLREWGATRASMVAYLIPVFGLALGAAVLGERIDARLIAGRRSSSVASRSSTLGCPSCDPAGSRSRSVPDERREAFDGRINRPGRQPCIAEQQPMLRRSD